MNQNCKLHEEMLHKIQKTLDDLSGRFDRVENMLVPLDNDKIGLVEQTRRNKEKIEELEQTPKKIKGVLTFVYATVLFAITIIKDLF
jgi:archaellum component FlaC